MPSVAAQYEIRWRLASSSGAWSTKIVPVTSEAITLDGLERGKSYEGEARALSAAGTPSDWTPVTFTVADPSMVPRAPTGLTALAVADGVSLKWTADAEQPADVEYCIERAATSSGAYTEFTRVRAMQYTYPLTDATVWWFRVRAVNFGLVYSAYSGLVSSAGVQVSAIAASAAAALAAAATAQSTADGKIDTFFQPAAPEHPPASLGDLWFDTGDGNKQYCSNGSAWVLAQDTAIGTAIANAAGAQSTANSKVRTWFAPEASPPTASATGDLWYVTDRAQLYRWSGSAWQLTADNSQVVIDPAVANPRFEAGQSGWGGWGTYVNWQATGGVGGTARALFHSSPGYRLVNEGRMPVRPGGILCVSAYLNRNGVAADVGFMLSVITYDENGTQLQVFDLPVTLTDVGPGGVPGYVRKFTGVIGPTARYALFNAYSLNTSGGAWGMDQVNMFQLADSISITAGLGANLAPNASFGKMTGLLTPWTVTWNPSASVYTIKNKAAGFLNPGYAFADGGNFEWREAGIGAGSPAVTDFGCTTKIPVTGGEWYEYSMLLSIFRCTAQLNVGWLDAAGASISEDGTPYFAENAAYDAQPPQPGRYALRGGIWKSPSNAAHAVIRIRKAVTIGGFGDSYVFGAQAYFGRAKENQTEFTLWADSAPATVDEIGEGLTYGNLALADGYLSSGVRRIGLRVPGSGQRIGRQDNLLQVVSQNVATTTKLSANSSGQVTVIAHVANYGSFTVSYSGVTNAVTGLTVGSTYVIYCIDDGFAGGTRTWYAGTNPATVAALGDGVYIAGQITIPSSGSSSGGGGGGGTSPGDWCVAADSFLPDGTLAEAIQPGMMLPCYNEQPNTPNIRHMAVERNDSANVECLRLVTTSGASIVASLTTPMTLRDGRCVPITDMLHREVIVYRLDGTFTWEEVIALQPMGTQKVSKIVVHQQCYFAGETMDAFIATHNPLNQKP
jgi:hypothetical protein